MHRKFLINGSILAGLAVAFGAFGAHGLQQLTSDEKILNGFRTGVQYQGYHALALLLVAVIFQQFPNKWIKWSGTCFITGIILFSGSLYILTLLKVQGSYGVRLVGALTPLGGLIFIAGWIFLLLGMLKKQGRFA
jgi:uncharacterized membrane protein YgdD (TMEM256/DUF423 family)